VRVTDFAFCIMRMVFNIDFTSDPHLPSVVKDFSKHTNIKCWRGKILLSLQIYLS